MEGTAAEWCGTPQILATRKLNPRVCEDTMGIALSTATHRVRTSDDPLFLTIGQVRARYGDVSVMWVNRHIKQNGMPAGIPCRYKIL